MDKLQEKVTKINPKKGFCNLILCAIVFFIIAGIGTIAKFGNRVSEMKQQIILTTSDYIFIGCVIAVFWVILSVYWLYTTAYVVSKAWEIGANAWGFGVLTLLTNLFGVACLWIYIKIHNVCPSCSRLQSKRANNCSFCGTAIYVKCLECGSRISVKDKYCNGCGKNMSE